MYRKGNQWQFLSFPHFNSLISEKFAFSITISRIHFFFNNKSTRNWKTLREEYDIPRWWTMKQKKNCVHPVSYKTYTGTYLHTHFKNIFLFKERRSYYDTINTEETDRKFIFIMEGDPCKILTKIKHHTKTFTFP